MSDVVNVTVITEDPPISIQIEEAPKISVSLYPVTVAHPSVFEAANRAEGSAEEASSAAEQAVQAAQSAIEAVESIGPLIEAEVSNQFGLKTTDDLSEGEENLYFTDERARAAAVVDSVEGSETDQSPSVAAIKTFIENIPSLDSENLAGLVYIKGDADTDNSWRFSVDVDNKLSIEVRLAGAWTLKGRWNP